MKNRGMKFLDFSLDFQLKIITKKAKFETYKIFARGLRVVRYSTVVTTAPGLSFSSFYDSPVNSQQFSKHKL